MLPAVVVTFINLFAFVFNILLLARVLYSWINPAPTGGLGGFLFNITEPVLAPVRKLIPGGGMMDWSPLIVFIGLQLIATVANRYSAG